MDLAGGSVRTQHHTLALDVESVPHVAGRVVRWHIKEGEVVIVALHLARAEHLEAHLGKDLSDAAHGLSDRM